MMGVRTPSGAPAPVAPLPSRELPRSVHFSMAEVCTFRWPLTAVAVARELAGFVWALMQESAVKIEAGRRAA